MREIHSEARESAIARVMSDFDRADEPINRHWAQIFATEESKQFWAPSAYDFIVLCNFLTNPVITDEFAEEIKELGRSLTPGGLLIALGGTGDRYPEVWSRLDELLQINDMTKIDHVSIQMQANDDPQRGTMIRTHMFDSMTRILSLCTTTDRYYSKKALYRYLATDAPMFTSSGGCVALMPDSSA